MYFRISIFWACCIGGLHVGSVPAAGVTAYLPLCDFVYPCRRDFLSVQRRCASSLDLYIIRLSMLPRLSSPAAQLMVPPTHILMLCIGWVGGHVYFWSKLHRRTACWQYCPQLAKQPFCRRATACSCAAVSCECNRDVPWARIFLNLRLSSTPFSTYHMWHIIKFKSELG